METEVDLLWRNILKTYYSDIYKSAYAKSAPSLTWEQLYRSMKTWPKLGEAKIIVKEFSLSRDYSENNLNFQVISDGIVGVLKSNGVVYYNVETLEQIQELNITENYECIRYSENDDIILLLDKRFTLFLKRKENRNKIEAVFYRVQYFLILNDIFYYVTFENIIYKCVYVNGVYSSTYLLRTYPVLALGHKNGVFHFMSTDSKRVNIFSMAKDKLKIVRTDASTKQQFEAYRMYNFTNNMHWTDFHYHDSNIKHLFPQTKNIHLLRTHGPILLAAYYPGIIRIFYSLYNTSVLDLLKSKPLKLYFVMEPNKQNCQILNIDVVEGENSHTVLVAMSHKILAIKFTHHGTNMEVGRFIGKPSSGCEELSTGSVKEKPTDSVTSSTTGVELPTGVQRDSSRKPSTSSEDSSSCGEPLPKMAKKSD